MNRNRGIGRMDLARLAIVLWQAALGVRQLN